VEAVGSAASESGASDCTACVPRARFVESGRTGTSGRRGTRGKRLRSGSGARQGRARGLTPLESAPVGGSGGSDPRNRYAATRSGSLHYPSSPQCDRCRTPGRHADRRVPPSLPRSVFESFRCNGCRTQVRAVIPAFGATRDAWRLGRRFCDIILPSGEGYTPEGADVGNHRPLRAPFDRGSGALDQLPRNGTAARVAYC
jgi:hypothetical protein